MRLTGVQALDFPNYEAALQETTSMQGAFCTADFVFQKQMRYRHAILFRHFLFNLFSVLRSISLAQEHPNPCRRSIYNS